MALTPHESFPQPVDDSLLLWRYLDTAKLLSLVSSRQLHLNRIDLFPDKLEGRHSKMTPAALQRWATHEAPGLGIPANTAAQLVRATIDNSEKSRKTFYASCWRSGPAESEAMWRLYCGSGDGVAIVLPYRTLRDTLTDPNGRTFIGKIMYLDYETMQTPTGNILNIAMCKRWEFAHEEEVRVLSWSADALKSPPDFDGPVSLTLPWSADDHIERIVVSPYAAPWYPDLLRTLFRSVSAKLVDRVQSSKMG